MKKAAPMYKALNKKYLCKFVYRYFKLIINEIDLIYFSK